MPNKAYAEENKNLSKYADEIDLNNIQNDPNVQISEILTYEEMAKQISIEDNISLEEAKEALGEETPVNILNTLNRSNSLNTSANTLSNSYLNITYTVDVNSLYKPQVVFRCEISTYGNYMGILNIVRVSMNRGYNGLSKIFDGDIYTELVNAAQIYVEVNGDFFNYGTVTAGVNVDIGIKEFLNVAFTASGESSHYAYCFKTHNIYT